jgi:dipeptidyl aminopeptidase/acylaminoacyl peptidase
LNPQNGSFRQITTGRYDCDPVQQVISPDGVEQLIGSYMSLSMPAELVSINPVSGEYTQLSFENKHILDQLTMGEVEERWITTTDKKKMLTWVIYPPHFDPSRKYPMVLFCAGGPQSALSQSWSYRGATS